MESEGDRMIEIMLWGLAFFVFYAYAGYPLLLAFLSRLFPKKVQKGPFEPPVSIIISAFNEERFIDEKLKNLLEMDYPAEKYEILIGSDGGSDETDRIIARFQDPRIRFFRFVQNLGKPHVLNGLIHESRGMILVFTDARQRFEPQAVRRLVENFADPQIGCVSGELFFEDVRGSGVAKGMDAYWRYEKWLRRNESALGSLLGATGAIYAVRRRLFEPLPAETLVDDMHIPLSVVERGFRVVFEPEARAYDFVSQKGGQEFKRKVRTLIGNYQILQAFPGLLNPFKSPVAWQLFSHKVLRLIVPFLLIALFSLNILLLDRPFYRMLFAVQCVFYGAAAAEMMRERFWPGRKGIGYIPYMFCLLNYSALLAFIRFFGRQTKGAWQKAY